MKTVAGATIVTGIAIGYAASWGTAVAHASTHQKALQYTCSVPGQGSASGSRVINWDSPDTATVDRPTPPVPISSSGQLSSSQVQELHAYGIASVTESGSASILVTAPQGNVSLSASFPSSTKTIPSSGGMTFVATGTLAPITFTRPGVANITVGTIVVNVTPRDSSGNPTAMGTETETCKPESGHNILLQSLRVDPVPQITHPPVPSRTPVSTPTHHPKPPPPTHSPTPTRSSHTTRPPSPSATPTNIPVALTGEDVGFIAGGGAIVMAGLGGLAAWLVARQRLRRRR